MKQDQMIMTPKPFITLIVCALTVSTARAQCQSLVRDEYQVNDADVIIGVMQDFYAKSEDGSTCVGPEDDHELYEAVKVALQALPNGMPPLNFKIGLERYESCGIPDRAAQDAAHYASEIVLGVNSTDLTTPCFNAPLRPGLIGPFSSGEALEVAATLAALGVPVVSHAATSPSLSDTEEYGSFLRTIPPDNVQGQVMVELLVHLGWTYVHMLHREGSYGEGGADAFKEAAKGQIELASVISVPKFGADYDLIVSQLLANGDAKAVVFWGSPNQITGLLTSIQSAGGSALDLQIVGSDYVSETTDEELADASHEMAAKGLITLAPGEYNNEQFQDYLRENGLDAMNHPYVVPVIDATHVFVDSLRRAHSSLCGSSSTGVCNAMKKLGSAEFLDQFVKTADFTGITGRRISFDKNGDPAVPAYEIRQYMSNNGGFTTQKVGDWTGKGTLNVQTSDLQFYTMDGVVTNVPPTSSCGSGSCPVVYDHYDIFSVAGIFPIHEPGCSSFSGHSAFEHSEAFLWAIDQVNRDSSLLPGMQLKPILGESCFSAEQASATAYDVVQRFARQPGRAFGYHQDPETLRDYYIAGAISHVSDEETVEIDRILQPLGLPQVSDSARLAALSDKRMFPYFSRMVAPSCAIVNALLEFLTEHDLVYVQVTQSRDGVYNDTAAKFIEEARERGICVAQSITFQPTTDYNDVVDRLLAKASADVIINFADQYESQFFFSALERRELPGEFLQVVYAFLGDTMYLDSSNRNAHVDSVTISRVTTPVEAFTDYFTSLSPATKMDEGLFGDSIRKSWFVEYWMNTFRCQLPGPDVPQIYQYPCSGNEALHEDYLYSTEGVINAVYVYAHALSNLHRDRCIMAGDGSSGLCEAMLSTTHEQWTWYLRNVRFMSVSGSMDEVSFDEDGDAPSDLYIKALASDLTNNAIAQYKASSGLTTLDENFAVGGEKKSVCRGTCSECASSETLGGTYYRIPGDFDIPAILWLSEEGADADLTCGATRYSETMAIEIIKYALEEINNDNSILPGVKLGLTVIDSCGQFLVTARQLIAIMGNTAPNLPPSGPMLGVLGPVREYLQGHVASAVTSPFYIPTIGFTPASPSVFSDEGPYPASSLLSTAPSYDQEAVAVVDVLKYKGWSDVLFIYSHSYYGHAGNDSFNDAARASGICVRESIGIDLESPQGVHDDIIVTIRNYNVTVVVAFVESNDARALLTAEKSYARTTDSRHKITWIGSDKWFTDPDVDVTRDLEDIARGAIVVTNYMIDLEPLKAHLSKLDMGREMEQNHWLQNYVTEELTGGCKTSECIQNVDLGRQGLLPAYTATLINAVYVLAQAAHNKIQIVCGNGEFVEHEYKRSAYYLAPSNETAPLCPEFYEASFHDLLYAVKDVYVFSGAGERPFWFENRQGPAEYSVINFQGDGTSGRFVPVGEWTSGELTMQDNLMYLYNARADKPIPASSECLAKSNRAATCPPASTERPGHWAWGTERDAWNIVVLIVAAVGGFLSVAAILVFIGRRKCPLLRESNPFLMSMLALGIILMYLNNIWYMVEASDSSCGVRRWMTSFSYSVVYAVLITRVISANILSRQDSAVTTMFTTKVMQVVLFCVFVGAEVILVTEWLILVPPSASAAFETEVAGCSIYVGHVCDHDNSSIVTSMIYVYILVLMTFVLSFFTSNRTHVGSKNEGKFILLTSLLSICFLVAWACCYTLLPENNVQTPAILIGITVDATSIFLLMIVPKMTTFFNGENDDDDEAYNAGELYAEKRGLDNKGAVLNEADHQTPM